MNVHRVRTAGEPAFDGLLRVYTAALPATERKSVDALRQMIARAEYLFLAVEDGDQVVGFAIAVAVAGSEAALLEYMAVDAGRRGRGIGRLLFRSILGWPELHARFLLIEVDSSSVPSPQQAERVRRTEFYRRLGCRQISGLTYLMPPVATTEPPLMDMLVHARELPASIDKSRLRAWLQACYTQVYDQPASDPRIDTMLTHLGEDIALT